ncbi:carbohydrate kinase family protein [Dyadobacter tibetensis]|uniref:carbohydrate kinase family protein n=1 Tax=Dyadobacter tibetensis TaxID=1211851 RepID=UPI00047042F9|nr:carbohydrate kinase family protein [Dyadobacter tibetensis]
MKKFDVSVIGELNVDFIFNDLNSFPSIGKEIISGQMDLTLGSSSAILASNLSSLGGKISFVGKIGTDYFGEFILQSLQHSGVHTQAIIRKNGLKTGATIALNYGDERAMITHTGAMDHLFPEDIDWYSISQSKHLHISSYFIQKGLQKDIVSIFRQAKMMGLSTSFDPQWDPSENWDLDLSKILPFVDIFLPNRIELLKLTDTQSIDEALKCTDSFANTIVVKLGREGSIIHVNGKSNHLPAFLNQQVVDAIGAGDSFNAGYIYRYLQGSNPMECQEFGNIIGAISTTAKGGTGAFSNREKIFQFIKEKYGYVEKQYDQ